MRVQNGFDCEVVVIEIGEVEENLIQQEETMVVILHDSSVEM